MKKIFKNISFIVLAFLFIGGTFTVPDWVLNSVVFIMDEDKPIGSGFLLGVDQDGTQFIYLVSAKHVIERVLKDSTKPLILRFNRKNKAGAVTLNIPTKFFNNKRWIEHPNTAIDIVALPLPIFDKIDSLEIGLFMLTDSTEDFFCDTNFIKKYKVRPGDQVFTVGLVPHLYNKDEKNLVLSRFGTVSSLPQYEIQLPGGMQKTYFLDCPAFSGNSGGPAFVILERDDKGAFLTGWRIALLGVVSEFVPSPLRMRKIKTDEALAEAVQLIENTGISKVVPIDYLKDILYSNEQIEFRNTIINQKK